MQTRVGFINKKARNVIEMHIFISPIRRPYVDKFGTLAGQCLFARWRNMRYENNILFISFSSVVLQS